MDTLRAGVIARIKAHFLVLGVDFKHAEPLADDILALSGIKEALELRAARMRLTDTHGWPPLSPNP